MSDLILHQYDFSNYAEKVRLAFGYKHLHWHAVTIPPVAPKPDLVPLTGGYRRTPVLQIGADIYCDTRLILRQLERLQPAPTLYPPHLDTAALAMAHWAENQLFRPISLYVSGTNADVLPQDLQADRSRMRGLAVPDAATIERAAKRNAPAVRIGLASVERLFSDGRPWVTGDAVSVADFSIYHALWFVTGRTQRLVHELTPFRRIGEWMVRMRGFGHGSHQPMSAKSALEIAAAATPLQPSRSQPHPEDPPLGCQVRVRADDYGRDPVVGELVYIDDLELALRRHDDVVGEIIVHFPRLGYDLRALDRDSD